MVFSKSKGLGIYYIHFLLIVRPFLKFAYNFSAIIDWDHDQFAWITPLLGDISPSCKAASESYISALMSLSQPSSSRTFPPGIPPEFLMFDSNGRLPLEGFLSDTLDIPLDVCTLVGITDCTSKISSQLRFINLKIPAGYSSNPGNYEECLTAGNRETRYCTVTLIGPDLGFGSSPFGIEGRARNFNPTLENLAILRQKFQALEFASKAAMKLPTLEWADFAAISNYTETLREVAGVDEVLQEQLLLLGLAIYSAISQPRIGMCFPKSCSVEDINENYRVLTEKSFEEIHLNATFSLPIKGNLTINTADFQCYTDDNRTGTPETFPVAYIIFYCFLSIIGLLIIFGTICDLYLSHFMENKKPKSFDLKILLSFSAYTNGKRLLSTESIGSDHLDCLNGIRFISMTWVVLGHTFLMYVFNSGVRNKLVIMDVFSGGQGLAFEAVLNALPSVDSFFLMAGTLTSYILFKELEKAGDNVLKHIIVFILYYVHRYLRITITYAIIIGFVITIYPYVYYGPDWFTILALSEECKAHWWANLLYIQTLIQDGGQCLGVSWYLVDDMIFHWFSPIIMLPMFLAFKSTKRHIVGLSWWLFTMICFTVGVFYIALTTRSPPSELIAINGLETNYTYHVSFYYAPWARYQAYLVGILLGYILHHTKGRQVRINEAVNILLWQASFLGAFAVVYGLHEARSTGEISLFSATMYNSFQRLAWNGALAWVIFSCVNGSGGLVNDFLSWSAFAPLSRLTFCAYLIHMDIIQMFFFSVLSTFPNDISMWVAVWYFLPTLMITLVAAFIIALCIESPSVRVEKLLIETILKGLIPQRVINAENHLPATKINGLETNGVDKKETQKQSSYDTDSGRMNVDKDETKYHQPTNEELNRIDVEKLK